MRILVDTNVLLRQLEPNHVHHQVALAATVRLLAAGEELCVAVQNITEFWVVATRPTNSNGLGLDLSVAAAAVDQIEHTFTLLPEDPALYAIWKSLVITYHVGGLEAYDARLVAVMQVHNLTAILTFNAADFRRYGISVLDPAAPPG
jgi:predicted nucleic acid-binding protein